MMYDPIMDRANGHRAFDEREDFAPRCMPRRGRGVFEPHGSRGDFEPHGMPREGREGFGPRAMPRGGYGPRDFGNGYRAMPGRPGGHGFPPGGMPPFGGPGGHGDMPPRGGRPPHDLPPRRPDPAFLKRRIEEADLGELLDMAQRLSRRPQGNPAHAQALILSILAGRETLSQRQLQQMLGIQPGSLSELLSKLEAKGLLTREKAEDRRGNLLRITDAGRQAILQEEDAPEDDPFAPLSAEQQGQLSDLLRALLNAWVDGLEPAPLPRPEQKPIKV